MLPTSLKQIATRVSERIPLQTVLILPFVCQIVGIVGLVSYFSFRNEQQSVNDLASQLRLELTNRIEEKLVTYTELPHAINRFNAIAFSEGKIDVQNTRGEYQFWQQIEFSPAISLIYCGSEQDGSVFGVGRLEGKNSLQIWLSNPSTGNIPRFYSLDSKGNRAQLQGKDTRTFDSRRRPWYKSAVAAGKPAWSEIYLDFTTGLPTITASVPVYNTTNSALIGVCATDLFLPQEMNQFLKNMQIGKSGSAFIMERSGQLISASTAEPTTMVQGKTMQRLFAVDSQNPTVQATATYLRDRFGNFNQIQVGQQLDFTLHGKRQLVQVLPFRDSLGLDWLIVIVVPELDFMGRIYTNNRIMLTLCLVALAVGILICIATARWITRPIVRLSQSAKALARGDWDQTVPIQRSGDLGELATSFNSMAQQLQAAFAEQQQAKQLLADYNVTLREQVAERTLELEQEIEERKRVEADLRRERKQAAEKSILEERNRIAREIHDSLAQNLTGIVIQMETAKVLTPEDAKVRTPITQAHQLARDGLAEARRSVWALRPCALEHGNLKKALEHLVRGLTTGTSVQVDFELQNPPIALPEAVEINLLRIAQESVMNAVKYAQASQLRVELTFNDQTVRLQVQDNGQGFDLQQRLGKGFGLVGIRERVEELRGQLTIVTQPGAGTAVQVVVVVQAS